MSKRRALFLSTSVWVSLFSLHAEEGETAYGHSAHGEVFNEGPRQAAVLIPGTGEMEFSVTTESEEAQAFFNQGIGQLHGFWDFEAERSFRQVAKIDPDCAMAYWGMAMANFKNDTRGKGFVEKASERKDSASPREQAWIEALAEYFEDTKRKSKDRLRDFVRALEDLATTYPDDIEAQAFLLKQIYYNHSKELAIPSHYVVNLLAEKILLVDPDHPANHYQIHLWDREDAAKALSAAAKCGPAAPAIAHMWHMPGHIYSRLDRFADSAWQQEASARIDHAHMMRFQIIPDQIHNYAHNNEWLIRNLNSLGQLDRSIALAENMISLPRLPKFKEEENPETYDPKGSSWQYGRQRLRDTLVRFEQWERLIAESETGVLQVDEKSIQQRDHDRFVGIAKFECGDIEGGRAHLASLETSLSERTKEQEKTMTEARTKASNEGKSEDEIEKAGKEAGKKFQKDIDAFQQRVDELRVYEALSIDPADPDKALSLLPNLKNLSKSRHARLWMRAGNLEKATSLAADAVTSGKGEVLPLATQVEVLFQAHKAEEAKLAFEQLRTLADSADLDIPALSRLTPAAKEFGYDTFSPVASLPNEDLGERPPLDSLGPFEWFPPSAPRFALPDATGKVHSLADFQGRPVLVLFFLGKDCSHCMDQLNAFATEAETFRKSGIEIIAVSSDTAESLTLTKTPEDKPFPFPIFSDSSLDQFRAFRAYDDFEEMALHGTFLIDGNGLIRWQQISYEPFMHPDWLLEECRRLLSFNTD